MTQQERPQSMFGPLAGPSANRKCGRCGRGFSMDNSTGYLHPMMKWCCDDCGEKDPWRRRIVAGVTKGLAAGKGPTALARELKVGERVVLNIQQRLKEKAEAIEASESGS